jgi:hypothetical protein
MEIKKILLILFAHYFICSNKVFVLNFIKEIRYRSTLYFK